MAYLYREGTVCDDLWKKLYSTSTHRQYSSAPVSRKRPSAKSELSFRIAKYSVKSIYFYVSYFIIDIFLSIQFGRPPTSDAIKHTTQLAADPKSDPNNQALRDAINNLYFNPSSEKFRKEFVDALEKATVERLINLSNLVLVHSNSFRN